MLKLQLSQQTWLHKYPAWLKLLLLACSSVAFYKVDSLTPMLMMLCITIGLYISLGKNGLKTGIKMLKPILYMSTILLIYHIIINDTDNGLIIALRFIILVALANLLTMTTSLQEMLVVFKTLTQPLSLLGIRSDRIALAIAMVIRFTPTLVSNAEQLRMAWRARSNMPASWRIITPLFIETMDDASHISEAIRARGGG